MKPFITIMVGLLVLMAGNSLPSTSSTSESFQAPVLLWSRGGCTSWCQTGWYSSPAVANLDSDPQAEVIASGYTIFILDGLTGATQLSARSGHAASEISASDVGRTWPDIVLANIDGVPGLEIATAHSDGWLSVYSTSLEFLSGWPKQVTDGNELRSLAASDMDRDGNLELLVASTRSENQWYAFEHNGGIRAGAWPQHSPDSNTNGYTAGCFNQNIAAGDLDGDGLDEVVGPNDTHYIAAFEDTGVQIPANSMYGAGRVWSRVGVHVDHAVDLRGYANCGTEHRPNFAHSAPIIVDVDGNGVMESVVVGNVHNCGTSPYTDLYDVPLILTADRTRWKNSSYDWTVLPQPEPGSAPLSEDYDIIENTHPNPSAADLDGDGNLEILYPAYDGRIHAYWLDKTEHGAWPYSVYQPGEGFIRFASEALVADLDADGSAEVIFTSWTEKDSNRVGKLHILSSMGIPIYEIDLPAASGSNWNGAMAAPTLANLDSEPGLELVINTSHSGVVAYDLPGTENARVLWGTGRGSYLRNGTLQTGYITGARLKISQINSQPGQDLQISISFRGVGQQINEVSLTNPIPAGFFNPNSLSASSGIVELDGDTLEWTDSVDPGEIVSITYHVEVDPSINQPTGISSTAQILFAGSGPITFSGHTIVLGLPHFFPEILR